MYVHTSNWYTYLSLPYYTRPATTLTSTWCRLGTCEYCCSKYLQS